MSYASQFTASVLPLGALVQGINLSEPQWVRCDGLPRARASFPRLSTLFPFGRLTGTVRTLAASPTSLQVVASADHFVAAGGATSLAIQYSTDGVTWATATTATQTVIALIATPSRYITLSSSAQQPLASATLVPTSTWALTASGPVSVAAGNSLCRLAYGAGKVVAVSGNVVHTLDDGSTTWVSRTSSGGANRMGACWTGSRFVMVISGNTLLQLSTDGITWTDGSLREATSASQGNIASNGSGVVVASGSPSGLQLSTDHGLTWDFVSIPGVQPSDTWRVQYAGDRFWLPTALGMCMSLDGRSWFLDTTHVQPFVTAAAVAKKGDVVVQTASTSAAVAYSYSESSTHFATPRIAQQTPALSGNPMPYGITYIKAT